MWIYLVCSTDLTYSQELPESHLPYENIATQNITVKSTHIVKQSSYQEWQLETSTTPPSGMISKPFSQENSEPSTLLSAASRNHVRTSALQDMEGAWKESEADYFSRSCDWPKKSSPSSYFLKTSRQSQAEGDYELLEKLPKWGMTVDGALYPLHPLEHFIDAKGGSYWPTPQARAQTDTPSERKRHTPCLETAVKMYATPTASQANKPIRQPSPSRQKGEHGDDIQDSIGRLNPSNIGKKLCPKWVSVLMGYPITWLDLEVSVMPWFLSKSKKRSKS